MQRSSQFTPHRSAGSDIARAAQCPNVPQTAAHAQHTQIAKTNPPPRTIAHHGAPSGPMINGVAPSIDAVTHIADAPPRTAVHHGTPLTHQQRIAARLVVAGVGSLEIARQLKIGRNTIVRWKRDPRFLAELDQLTTMLDRALIQHLLPSIVARVRQPLFDPMADPPLNPPTPLPAELPKPAGAKLTFAEMAIHLGQYGIYPKTHPQEFRDAMRRAGIYK